MTTSDIEAITGAEAPPEPASPAPAAAARPAPPQPGFRVAGTPCPRCRGNMFPDRREPDEFVCIACGHIAYPPAPDLLLTEGTHRRRGPRQAGAKL